MIHTLFAILNVGLRDNYLRLEAVEQLNSRVAPVHVLLALHGVIERLSLRHRIAAPTHRFDRVRVVQISIQQVRLLAFHHGDWRRLSDYGAACKVDERLSLQHLTLLYHFVEEAAAFLILEHFVCLERTRAQVAGSVVACKRVARLVRVVSNSRLVHSHGRVLLTSLFRYLG